MKRFKKWGFWVLFGLVVLVGALFIVDFGLQNQSPVIPDVSAQTERIFDSGLRHLFGPDMGVSPHNILFSYQAPPGTRFGSFYADILPGDVMFGLGTHPGSYIFAQKMFPGDIILGGSNGKTEMRTIMTCSGCSQTMSTCDWYCGPTFSYCHTGTVYGGSIGNTLTTCGGNLFGVYGCGSTSSTCGIICSATLLTCPPIPAPYKLPNPELKIFTDAICPTVYTSATCPGPFPSNLVCPGPVPSGYVCSTIPDGSLPLYISSEPLSPPPAF